MQGRSGLLIACLFLVLGVLLSAALATEADISGLSSSLRRAAPANSSAASNTTHHTNTTQKLNTTGHAGNKTASVKKEAVKNETDTHSHKSHKHKQKDHEYRFPNTTWFNSISKVQIGRVLEASAVITDALFAVNHTVHGLLKVNGSLDSVDVFSVGARTKTLETKKIRSPTGTVVIDGDMMIINSKGATDAAARRAGKTGSFGIKAVSFLAEEVVISGVKQWKLVRHDSFESEAPGHNPTDGWSFVQLSSCSRNRARTQADTDHFLGGHCNIAEGELRKTYHSLPPHKQLRVAARYHMIDNWSGETAFLKLGEQYVWTERSRAANDGEGLDMCGSESYPERRISIPIDVTVPHSSSLIEVSFGSTALSKNKGKEDPCQRSFGVDDVMLYVR